MKTIDRKKTKLFFLATTAIILSVGNSTAQNEWSGAGANNTTGEISRTGRVGIGGMANSNYALDVLSGSFHTGGTSFLDGGMKVGTLKVNGNQICIESNSDLFINNAALGNGNVKMGRPDLGEVRVLRDFRVDATSFLDGGMKVSTLKVTSNQICVESNSDLFINNAALGNGNVNMGKPFTGVVSVLNEFNVGTLGSANFRVKSNGQTRIGVQGPDPSGPHSGAMLSVDGQVIAKSFYVTIAAGTWADYVFDKNYKLMSLQEVESFIGKNHHLPGVPSALEVERAGMSLAETNVKLLEKLEEAYLYILELDKRVKVLEETQK